MAENARSLYVLFHSGRALTYTTSLDKFGLGFLTIPPYNKVIGEDFMPQRNNHQSGNVLFIIFIAILLLAALSFAVTSSSRTGNNISEQQANLNAAQIISFANKVNRAVTRIQNMTDCPIKEISFHHDIDGNGVRDTSFPDSKFYNTYTSSDDCLVFDPQGGNIEYQDPPASAIVSQSEYLGHGYMDYIFTGGLSFYHVGENCPGTTCTDLAMVLWGLNKETCEAINRQIYKRTDIPRHEFWAFSPNDTNPAQFYRGEFLNWAAQYTLAHPATSYLSGNPMGCSDVRWYETPPYYTFYSILIAR